jgi:hypothetical protein
MWICKNCGEENEDSFDTCYKCLTFSEEGASKSVDYQKKIEKENLKEKKEKPKKKKGNIYLSLLFAFVTFIIVGSLTKFSKEPFIKVLPALSSFIIFKFLRNTLGDSTIEVKNQIISKKEEDEIYIKTKSTGEIRNIKRDSWKHIINSNETHLYEVVYDIPNDDKNETTNSSIQKNIEKEVNKATNKIPLKDEGLNTLKHKEEVKEEAKEEAKEEIKEKVKEEVKKNTPTNIKTLADNLRELNKLKVDGILTEEEFNEQKKKLLKQ